MQFGIFKIIYFLTVCFYQHKRHLYLIFNSAFAFWMQVEIELIHTQPAALYDLRDPKPSIFSMRT